jgi:hypothetical protein
VLVGSLVGIFVLDVMLPGVVLLPFMYVPVVAAATFAVPGSPASWRRWP